MSTQIDFGWGHRWRGVWELDKEGSGAVDLGLFSLGVEDALH